MARAPWKAELLDKWRMLGDDQSDPTLHRDRGVDSFIARFVRSINEFVRTEVAPDHQIQWRDPRTGAWTSSRETYGDIAVQAILYKLFSDRGVPQKRFSSKNCILYWHTVGHYEADKCGSRIFDED